MPKAALFINGRGDFPEEIFNKLEKIVVAINIALKAIIPNLSIEIVKTNEEKNKDGINIVQVEVYSNRDGKRFLTKYESEGIIMEKLDKAVIFIAEGATDKRALENIFKKIYRYKDIHFEFTHGDITSDE